MHILVKCNDCAVVFQPSANQYAWAHAFTSNEIYPNEVSISALTGENVTKL